MDKVQRLMLINQYRILDFLEGTNEQNNSESKLAITALQNGFEREVQALVKNAVWTTFSMDECDEAINIFNLFRRIEFSLRKLDSDESSELRKLPYVEFPGFDGNEETGYYSYATYVLEDQGRFPELYEQKHDVNSHHATLTSYRSMLRAAAQFGSHGDLSAAQIRHIAEQA